MTLQNLLKILDKYESQFGLTTSQDQFELFHGLNFYNFHKPSDTKTFNHAIGLLVYFLSFSLSNGKAQYQGQTLNERENVNATSSDEAVYDQTNVPSDNQTMRAPNDINGTSANGTTSEILTNALQQQQPQAPLQSPPSLQQQPLQPPPIMQPLPQQPQQPFTSMPPTIPVSIVPNAATRGNQAFQPNPIYVNILTGITWINYDTQIHTVTSGSAGSPDTGQIFDSNILNPSATFTQFFVQYGTFPYHCTLHPQMVGTVVVL